MADRAVSMSDAGASAVAVPASARWLQLLFGIICMVMIANLQYGWTLFVNPIDEKYHWGRTTIQVAFTIFVLTETWLVPIEGWLVDHFGPKIVVFAGGIFVGIAWTINSAAHEVWMLYAAAAIGGIGAGAVYGTSIGNALKWFPDRRGLAAGLTAAGFGAGSALTIIPIQGMIQSRGYEATFLWFGVGQGLVVVALSLLLRAPRSGEMPPSTRVRESARDYTPIEVLCSPIFWVMYAMFVLVGAGGLMATAQLAPDRQRFPDRQGSGIASRAHSAGIDLRIVDRPRAQRSDAAVFRLGVGPDRAREHDVCRVLARSGRDLGAQRFRARSGSVRGPERAGVLRLG